MKCRSTTVHHLYDSRNFQDDAEDANPFARTVHFASGKTSTFKKSLQNVDIYCSTRGSNFKAPNANLIYLFFICVNYFSNRHCSQTKEKELKIVENYVNETCEGLIFLVQFEVKIASQDATYINYITINNHI